jgi:hypothetical protein
MDIAQGTVCKNIDDFRKVKPDLEADLARALEEEALIAEFENEEEEDLWDCASVDSKAVIKLSPIVEEHTGKKVKPEWIKPGGYDSVDEAITHLMEQLELEFRPVGERNE